MFTSAAKRLVARLPRPWPHELRRYHFRRQILNGSFSSDEPDFAILDTLLRDGDWVIDVGANVGHYTKRFSELVGSLGRVIAIEPVAETFAVLAGNACYFGQANVTLINAAASDATRLLSMNVPVSAGVKNYYQATVTAEGLDARVLAITLDSLAIAPRVALIKIDAEGHEVAVIRGAVGLLRRDRPIVIAETNTPEVAQEMMALGYSGERLRNSPNMIFRI